MKRTFVTVMPDHIGAFMRASKCFAELNINITRVSYNKAIDSHYLFIDAEGTEEQLALAYERLSKIGYLQNGENEKDLVLFEFKLPDKPGSVFPLLELIADFHFNISYISSQENGTDHQLFKMGLVAEKPDDIQRFINSAREICNVRIIDYNHADNVYDNSIFYRNFVTEISSFMDITPEYREELLVNVNLAMQQLDESGVSPFRTFDSISRFAELLAASKNKGFEPRISKCRISDNTVITLIEPPCGSNTAIINSNGRYLFIDSGYACFSEEMNGIFRSLIEDFDSIEKNIIVTHADVDHCGMLNEFDNVYCSDKSAQCLKMEYGQKNGFREQNKLHKPYISICKILTSYKPTLPEKIKVIGNSVALTEPLTNIGAFDFEELHFEIYEGRGGHLPGEIALIDYKNHIVFSGDVYLNMKNMTARQEQYNRYAPILMTSVDTDKRLCSEERAALFQRLGIGTWHIFGGHGGEKIYKLNLDEELL